MRWASTRSWRTGGTSRATWLDGYTRVGSPLGDHPDMRRVPGIDFSSGSLGHGLSIGVGMAAGARLRGQRGDPRVRPAGRSGAERGPDLGGRPGRGAVRPGQPRSDRRPQPDGARRARPRRSCRSSPSTGASRRSDGASSRCGTVTTRRRCCAASTRCPRPTREVPTCVVARTVKGKGVGYMEQTRTWHLGYLGPDDERAATAGGRSTCVTATTRRCPPSPAGIWRPRRKLAHSAVAGEVLADMADEDDRIVVVDGRPHVLEQDGGLSEPPSRALPQRGHRRAEHGQSSPPGSRRSASSPTPRPSRASSGLLAAEQLRTDLAYPGLPVRLLAHHAGISLGFYGTSHHATEDLGLTPLDRRYDRRLSLRRRLHRVGAAHDGRPEGARVLPPRPGARARRLRRGRTAGRPRARTPRRSCGMATISRSWQRRHGRPVARGRGPPGGRAWTRGGGRGRAQHPPVRRRWSVQARGPHAGACWWRRSTTWSAAWPAPARTLSSTGRGRRAARPARAAAENALSGRPTALYRTTGSTPTNRRRPALALMEDR